MTPQSRNLYLHVGTHKTGTTAIQAYMSQCREALAAQGILYPSLRPGTWKEMDAHHKVAQALARHSVIDRLRLRRYRRWIDCQPWARTVVLSAEPIYRHIAGKVVPGDLTRWFLAHLRYLQRCADWLDGFHVRAVVYFRQPETLATSMYKEHIVRRLLPRADRTFDRFLDLTAHYYEYAGHLHALESAFDGVIVRDYDAARKNGLQQDFALLVGATALPAPVRQAVRTSPPDKATLWLAAQPAQLRRRDHFRRVLFAVRARPGLFGDTPTTLWPSRSAFERFVGRHAAAWQLPFIAVPTWEDLPSATLSEAEFRSIETEFAQWETRNLSLLRLRESRGLAFFEPDPA